MSDSMPLIPNVDDDFNFNDLNFDFLEPTPQNAAVTTISTEFVEFFNTDIAPSHAPVFENTKTKIFQELPVAKSSLGIKQLALRVAETDKLVRQLQQSEAERNELKQKFQDLRQSAEEVRSLYSNEKRERMELQAKFELLECEFEKMDTELTGKNLAIDQMQAQLEDYKGPFDYPELVTRYLRLAQKLQEQRLLHWQETTVVNDLNKYCQQKQLKVPHFVPRSPCKRKKCSSTTDAQIQCDIGATTQPVEQPKIGLEKVLCDQATQCEQVATRTQACQYRATTTTRSTTTACFFKYHDVGVNCEPLEPLEPRIDDVLKEIIPWGKLSAPISPIIELETVAPPSSPPPFVQTVATTGTCTYICNIQRPIEYAEHQPIKIKRSDSRPPSRLMFESVKNETCNVSKPATPLPLPGFPGQLPTVSHLFPSAFDELWQMFGDMFYGLLQRRIAIGSDITTLSNQANMQDFYNWLHTTFDRIHMENRHQQQEEVSTQSSCATEMVPPVLANPPEVSPSTTEGASFEQYIAASPLQFSNKVPNSISAENMPPNHNTAECASLVLRPKVQRSNKQAICDGEENQHIQPEHRSIATSPIRCIAVSPIPSLHISPLKNTENVVTVESNNQKADERDMPSAFKAPTKQINAKKEIFERYLKLRSRKKILTAIRRPLHRSHMAVKRKRKTETKPETAVDFIAQLKHFAGECDKETAQHNCIKQPKCVSQGTAEVVVKMAGATTKSNEKRQKPMSKRNLKQVYTQLFGSDTDDSDENDEVETTKQELFNVNTTPLATNTQQLPVKMLESDMKEMKDKTKFLKSNRASQNAQQVALLNKLDTNQSSKQQLEQQSLHSVTQLPQTIFNMKPNTCAKFTAQATASKTHEKSTTSALDTLHSPPIKSMQTLTQLGTANKDTATPSSPTESAHSTTFIATSTACRMSSYTEPFEDIDNSDTELVIAELSAETINEENCLETLHSAEHNSTPPMPKKRGRKRKSECSATTTQLVTPTKSPVVPCKRSARLRAKLGLLSEEKIETVQTAKPQQSQPKTNIKHKLVAQLEIKPTEIKQCAVDEMNAVEDAELLQNAVTALINDCDDNSCAANRKEKESFQFNSSANMPSYDSPSSPLPFEAGELAANAMPTKEIPLNLPEDYCQRRKRRLSLLHNLIGAFKQRKYRSFNFTLFNAVESAQLEKLTVYVKEYLADLSSSATAVTNAAGDDLIVELTRVSTNSRLIAHAFVAAVQALARTKSVDQAAQAYSSIPITAAATTLLPQHQQRITYILNHLLPHSAVEILAAIESTLFNVQHAESVALNDALNLTDLFILTISHPKSAMATENPNPARLYIAKCLYYHKVKATPMIYAVLTAFPTVLPHREEHQYDRSDPLITVIKHVLMCTTYDMNNHELWHRELISKLRYEYHFEAYKPDFHEVLKNLIDKLHVGKVLNLQYAFALFCKRLPPDRAVRDVIQAHFMPLANEFYCHLQVSSEYDERAIALLDCFSSVIKPFPRDTDTAKYMDIFQLFLGAVSHQLVQEAALHAILRLQRFGYANCYKALANFRPDFDLQPHTRAALKTFMHRKSLGFWKTLAAEDGQITT